MYCSMPGFPVLHYILEFTQIHVCWVYNVVQPSHLLCSPSPPALNSFPASGYFQMSQFFASGGQSIRASASASVLPMNISGWFFIGLTGLILQSKGLSKVSNTTVQKHQLLGTQTSLWSNAHTYTWLNSFSSVQFSHSVLSDSLRPHGSQHAKPPCPSPTPGVYSNSCPSSRWCHPAISVVLFSSCPPIPPSIRVFSNQSTLRMKWPKYWNFSFSISPSNEHPGLISFRMDWLDLLTVQGTVKCLLQHHSWKASIFFGTQLSSQSNPHIHTWPLEKP